MNKRVILLILSLFLIVLLGKLMRTDWSNPMKNPLITIEQQRQQQQQQQQQPPQQQQSDEICTAELLLEESKHDVIDAAMDTDNASVMGSTDDKNTTKAVEKSTTKKLLGWNYSKDAREWRWLVPDRGRRACGLSSSSIKPLQSTPHNIHTTLSGKWVLIIGDSSVRMLHDYLVGRWLGGYTHWPKKMSNHGPIEHTRPCADDWAKLQKKVSYQPDPCSYDVFWEGARVTFIWFGLDLSEELRRSVQQTVGSPDVVVAQHGYWEKNSGRDETEARRAPEKITDILDHREMESAYSQAYHYDRRRHDSNKDSSTTTSNGNSTDPKKQKQQLTNQKRVWMSSFHNPSFGYGPYDGSNEAKELGWEIFNRTKLVDFDGNFTNTPHPMNEVLELELEILLVLLNATATASTT